MRIEFETTQTVTPPPAGAAGSPTATTAHTAYGGGVRLGALDRAPVRRGEFRRPPSLDEFVRLALFNAVRERITLIASGGGKIPPGVAKDYENWKANLKPGT